jgi:uncharacterized NAD-dependent epimerase/dehydratase family protein
MEIEHPYLLFIGDAADQLAAKTADGIAKWRPQWCVGQYRLPDCNADLGLPDLSLEEARRLGARTLIVGVANRGGILSAAWIQVLEEALERGYHVASGLHMRLSSSPRLSARAADLGLNLIDVRQPDGEFHVGDGRKRRGKRLLTVGTDCSLGKMFTALAIEGEMKNRGMNADFRATGQTGIFIAGSGVCVDAVVADFISGATEALAPAGDPQHWDIIEGQGSLFHPSYAGVALGLLHGSQPDCLVMCHDPWRPHMRGIPHLPLPDLNHCIEHTAAAARLTNANCRTIGISVNTSQVDDEEADRALQSIERETGLPTVDALRHGAARLVDAI